MFLSRGDNLSALDRILRGGPLPKARPKRQRQQHNAGDDGLLATNRSGYSLCPGWQDGTTAVPRVGAGAYMIWHINVQNASPGTRGARLSTPSGSDSTRKAKVAATVAASPDYLWALLAKNTTLASGIRPALLARRLRVV